jgi:ABC-2 type transport system permease protein
MAVFWYELRQTKMNVLVWTVVVSAMVVFLLPVFSSFLIDGSGSLDSSVAQSIEENDFLKAVDMSVDFLSKPIGMFGFLTSWLFGLACGCYALFLGLSAFTKEYLQKTADFIMTKPYSRGRVYFSKLLAATIDNLFIGVLYFLVSLATFSIVTKGQFDMRMFFLLGFSLIMLQMLHMSFGVFLGAVFPKIRKPLLVSVGIVFVTVMIGALAYAINSRWLVLLAPPKYFGGSVVANAGGYDMRYVAWLWFLVAVFIVAGYFVYRKKDVVLVS